MKSLGVGGEGFALPGIRLPTVNHNGLRVQFLNLPWNMMEACEPDMGFGACVPFKSTQTAVVESTDGPVIVDLFPLESFDKAGSVSHNNDFGFQGRVVGGFVTGGVNVVGGGGKVVGGPWVVVGRGVVVGGGCVVVMGGAVVGGGVVVGPCVVVGP